MLTKEHQLWFETIDFHLLKIISDETFTVQININKNTCQIKENSHIKKDVKCYIMRENAKSSHEYVKYRPPMLLNRS